MGEYSPEKAGVGGSIPSLATMFSATYKSAKPESCSKMFQLQIGAQGFCLEDFWISAL